MPGILRSVAAIVKTSCLLCVSLFDIIILLSLYIVNRQIAQEFVRLFVSAYEKKQQPKTVLYTVKYIVNVIYLVCRDRERRSSASPSVVQV